MHMNQFGRQWAGGHIDVVANCLFKTLMSVTFKL